MQPSSGRTLNLGFSASGCEGGKMSTKAESSYVLKDEIGAASRQFERLRDTLHVFRMNQNIAPA
jgi:hypothetical protein